MIIIEKTFPITEKLIQDALSLAQQLNEELNQEADTLKKAPHSDSIELIAAKKKQLVTKLEQFNSQLGQVLATENLPNSQQGLSDYFHRATAANLPTEKVANNWEAFRFIIAESKNLNDQNGASIDLLARHTKRSLQILKGKSQFATTYGPDGTTHSETYHRTLVFA